MAQNAVFVQRETETWLPVQDSRFSPAAHRRPAGFASAGRSIGKTKSRKPVEFTKINREKAERMDEIISAIPGATG